MNLELNSTLFAIITFTGILGSLLLGNRVGTIVLAKNPEGENKSIGAIEGAVFGLLGLMVDFTFSGAASRFEDRRHLITDEANAIGTAWLRASILPADAQPEIRKLFLQYINNRTNVYRDNKNQEGFGNKAHTDSRSTAKNLGVIRASHPAGRRRKSGRHVIASCFERDV
jgi:hypothetical protein